MKLWWSTISPSSTKNQQLPLIIECRKECNILVLYVKPVLTEPLWELRRVWRYQRGNQNPYNEAGETTQWPKEKGQKDKQRSTKHTHKTKDRVTRTSLKTGGELRCSGRISSSCSTSGTCLALLCSTLTSAWFMHVKKDFLHWDFI